MSNASEIPKTKYYQVLVVFHAFVDKEYYYKVEAYDRTDAIKRAIDRAYQDLHVKRVVAIGAGTYEVIVNFNRFADGDKYYMEVAAKEEEAAKLALMEAKHDFEGKVIFYEEKGEVLT